MKPLIEFGLFCMPFACMSVCNAVCYVYILSRSITASTPTFLWAQIYQVVIGLDIFPAARVNKIIPGWTAVAVLLSVF